ncbi:hypothetical protein [Kitasatospora aureofaciens]|uniref:hypothetical protein n=1 Tax=Kitasatospora aureofaciens TaxID=1894 RepID=UPI0034098489
MVMMHVADLVLAGVLGAVILAVALLARSHARQGQLISSLRAELTAQKIVAMTTAAAVGAEREVAESSPVRAKGHLSLCANNAAGGTAIGERFRGTWARYRHLTITVTAAGILAGGAAAVAVASVGPYASPGNIPPAVAPGVPGKKSEQRSEDDDCDDSDKMAGGARDPRLNRMPLLAFNRSDASGLRYRGSAAPLAEPPPLASAEQAAWLALAS